MPCFIRQALDAARLVTDDHKIHEKVLREVLHLTSEMDLHQSPPAMGQKIHRLIRDLTGSDDPYREIKNRFNKLALQLYPDLKQTILSDPDPLETATRFALAGNIIDFGVNSHLTEAHVKQALEEASAVKLDKAALHEFRKALTNANDILYLADNAGEIVFDRMLVEQLPEEKITFVVKARPVINDATIEDARIAGLTDMVTVIDNGSDAPGTILQNCSDDFRRRFDTADLVIAKGQGNYETLSDVDKDVFFILKAKCPVIARHLGCEIGSMVLVKNKVGICNERN